MTIYYSEQRSAEHLNRASNPPQWKCIQTAGQLNLLNLFSAFDLSVAAVAAIATFIAVVVGVV